MMPWCPVFLGETKKVGPEGKGDGEELEEWRMEAIIRIYYVRKKFF